MRLRCSIHFIIFSSSFLILLADSLIRTILLSFRGSGFMLSWSELGFVLGRALGPISFWDFGPNLEMGTNIGAKVEFAIFSSFLTKNSRSPPPFPFTFLFFFFSSHISSHIFIIIKAQGL